MRPSDNIHEEWPADVKDYLQALHDGQVDDARMLILVMAEEDFEFLETLYSNPGHKQ